MKKRIIVAGLLLGLMAGLTACGGETARNIQENNEISMGVNLENQAKDLVNQNNETNQNMDDSLDISGEE
jgi:ABC-type phosphate/phosphonate transport system substrate-binding protein